MVQVEPPQKSTEITAPMEDGAGSLVSMQFRRSSNRGTRHSWTMCLVPDAWSDCVSGFVPIGSLRRTERNYSCTLFIRTTTNCFTSNKAIAVPQCAISVTSEINVVGIGNLFQIVLKITLKNNFDLCLNNPLTFQCSPLDRRILTNLFKKKYRGNQNNSWVEIDACIFGRI